MSLGTGKQTSNTQTTNDFAAMDEDEKKLVTRMSELGVGQADAIQFVTNNAKGGGQFSSLTLNPQDQAALDASYSGAEANLRRFGNLMGQDLAGTRGLNPSDTPVSEAVLRETLPAYQSLMSSKAQQGLGLGMGMRQMNEGARQFNLQAMLGGAGSMPSALGFNLNRMLQERMGRNSQTSSGIGYQSDSIMKQVGQGAKAYADLGQGTNSFMSAFKGMG